MEEENRRLKRLVADQALDIQMLKDVASKKMVSSSAKRNAAEHLAAEYQVRVRRACGALGLNRSVFYYSEAKREDGALREAICALARERRRWGYRRITVKLRQRGWRDNHKRISRIYREEKLQVSRRKRKRISRKDGYATTFCDLQHHRVHDVVLGRSEAALDGVFRALPQKERVKVVCMDLAAVYRALVKRHMPQARIVADRFHVIRLVNHHLLNTWRKLDENGSKNRGLLSLMRRHEEHLKPIQAMRMRDYLSRHPALAAVYEFKQKLCRLLLLKHRTQRQCRRLIGYFLAYIDQLKSSGFESLKTLGQTLGNWREEIACMWRFTKNNGMTEGFHTKMEMIQRRAFGFRNFENYRLRVKALCA